MLMIYKDGNGDSEQFNMIKLYRESGVEREGEGEGKRD